VQKLNKKKIKSSKIQKQEIQILEILFRRLKAKKIQIQMKVGKKAAKPLF